MESMVALCKASIIRRTSRLAQKEHIKPMNVDLSAYDTGATEDFEAALAALEGGVPDAAEYQRLTTMMLVTPAVRQLAELDPFSAEYHKGVLDLYVRLRARPDDKYDPERDEAPSAPVPEDIWSSLVPWCFKDPKMVGEHLYAWAHIFQHIDLPKGGSLLEYGPGSGQLLLMLARMGFRACGVDVDAVALEGIRLQAEKMSIVVQTERALFGEGFSGERFDTILFYEAFHHALDFQTLLLRLHDRLKPGGHVILCGEPIVQENFPGIPYPWGPRLDALSVFCMRRFGWMELGFTHSFFTEAARRAGWQVEMFPFLGCGRAQIYVLKPQAQSDTMPYNADIKIALFGETSSSGSASDADRLRAELAAVHASSSWRITQPLRSLARLFKRR